MITRFAVRSALLAAALCSPAFTGGAAAASANAVPVVVDKQEKVAEATKDQPLSVVRVNVTNQPYDFFRPWSKRPPSQRRAVGAVLAGNRVLVTGELVANATYVELEKPDSGDKTPATVERVDYESNLALVKPADAKFLADFKPIGVAEASVGDDLAIWQLEPNGTLLSTRALLTTADVARYPIDDTSLLLYRLTSSLQPRDGSFTAPVVRGGTLAGMLLRYDSRTQSADVIPAPVIAHFLKAADNPADYTGFPRAGLSFSPLRDPQLRRYAGLTNGNGGVFITQVQRDGAAAKAGLQVGDVLLAVGDRSLDQDGNYRDPHYGKVSIIHLISTGHFDGEVLPFKISRKGQEQIVNVKLLHPDASKSVIEPYTVDKAPRYYVLGGLVFQELSRQFLKEWGQEWFKKAPERFLYFDRYQSELFNGDARRRVVIMSHVLPSPCTVGYEELNGLVVTGINGVPLKDLTDIDAALEKSTDGFHRIQFSGHPREIAVDSKQVKDVESILLKNYGLPAIKSLE